jgi:hypothetical protein
MTPEEIKSRLAYLKSLIIDERISYGEIVELQSLAKYIDPSDTQLLEWAGIDEIEEGNTKERKCHKCNTPVKYDKVSPDYFCYCPECDEDLYKFETKLIQ